MVSILDQLDRLGNEHPHKLLYSYLDLNGNQIEGYTYSEFLERTKAIASHLLRNGQFVAEDRLLLAYPPGLEMICAFFGCVRAGLIPGGGSDQQGLSRIAENESREEWGFDVRRGCRLHLRPAVDCHRRLSP